MKIIHMCKAMASGIYVNTKGHTIQLGVIEKHCGVSLNMLFLSGVGFS